MIRFLKLFFILSVTIPIYAQSEYIYILGNTQDAGLPHIGCRHKFCLDNFNKYEEFYVTSIAVVNSDLGDFVGKGEILAKLDDSEINANFMKAEANFMLAQLELDRFEAVSYTHLTLPTNDLV